MFHQRELRQQSPDKDHRVKTMIYANKSTEQRHKTAKQKENVLDFDVKCVVVVVVVGRQE